MATSSFVLRSVETTRRASLRNSGFLKRFTAYVMLGLVATMFLSFNPFGSPINNIQPAHAINFLDPCGNAKQTDLPDIESWPGQSSSLLGSDRVYGSTQGSPSASFGGDIPAPQIVSYTTNPNMLTAYEWYGTAGMTRYYGAWESLDGVNACTAFVERPANTIGSAFLDFTYFLGEVGLLVVSWGLSTNFTTNLLVGEDDGIISSVIAGFQNSLYQNYLLPVVMLAGIWIAWQGLVKRRGTEAIQGTTWVVLSAIAAAAFFIWPVEIARTADRAVGYVGTSIISAMASPSGESSICSLPEAAPEREIRTVQCGLWYTFIYQPWAASQFGPIAKNTIDIPGNAEITFRSGSNGTSQLPLYFLDARSINYGEVKTGNVRSDERRANQWNAFTDAMTEDKNKPGWATFAGKDGTGFADGLITLTALIFGTLPLVFFSFVLILQQVSFILLLLVGPLFLLAGLIPGQGRRLMLGWLELLTSTVIKRLVTYVAAGLLLTAIGIISASGVSGNFGAFAQIVMIIIAGVATVAFRQRILTQYGTVRLGGDQGFLSETQQMGENVKNRVKGSVTAPIVGASEARAAGKSSLVGAAKGFTRNLGNKDGAPKISTAAQAAVAGIKAPGKSKMLKLDATLEEKTEQLRLLKNEKGRQAEENALMISGSMSASDWREYSEKTGRPVPRPRNNAAASELLEAGVDMRAPIDGKMEREIKLLEEEIHTLNKEGANKVKKVLREQKGYRSEWDEYDRAVEAEYSESEQNSETPESNQPTPSSSPQPEPVNVEVEVTAETAQRGPVDPRRSNANPYARAKYWENRRNANKSLSEDGE